MGGATVYKPTMHLSIFWGLAALGLLLITPRAALASTATTPLPTIEDLVEPAAGEDARADDDDEEEEEPAARKRSAADPERASRGATGRRRIIKVVQRKHFMKLHRLEATIPSVGIVTNDPFLRRIIFSGKFEFHLTEITSVGAYLAFSPNLGESDLKQLTSKLQHQKEVVPDISRIVFCGIFDLGFSPIFGKVELGATKIINYDLYIAPGIGVLYTQDDSDLITETEAGKPYFKQIHPVTSIAFGFRIAFNEWFGVRLEARLLTHIEQVHREDGMNLEMKNNFVVAFGPSFFLPPRMKQASH